MTLANNSVKQVEAKLTALAADCSHGDAGALALAEELHLPVEKLLERYAGHVQSEGKKGIFDVVLDPRSPLLKLRAMRRRNEPQVIDPKTQQLRRADAATLKSMHATSKKFHDFDYRAALPLSQRERATLQSGLRRQQHLDKSQTGDYQRLPIEVGKHIWRTCPNHRPQNLREQPHV